MSKSPDNANLASPQRTPSVHACLSEALALGIPRDYGRLHGLRRVLEPSKLVSAGNDVYGRPQWLAPRAAAAWMRMQVSAQRDGVTLQLVSAFRSIEYQLGILKRKLAQGQSMSEILRVSAAPGYSEHHSGRSIDLTTPGYMHLEEDFEHSPAYQWLVDHAAQFNFVLSYPRENVHGMVYEPWHWCWQRAHSGNKASSAGKNEA